MSQKVTANLHAHSPLVRVIDHHFLPPDPLFPIQTPTCPHPPPLCSGRGATAERRGQVSPPERRPARPHRGVRAASWGLRQDGSRSGGDQKVSHTGALPFSHPHARTHTHMSGAALWPGLTHFQSVRREVSEPQWRNSYLLFCHGGCVGRGGGEIVRGKPLILAVWGKSRRMKRE